MDTPTPEEQSEGMAHVRNMRPERAVRKRVFAVGGTACTLAIFPAAEEVLVTQLRQYFEGQVIPLVPAEEAAGIGTKDDDE